VIGVAGDVDEVADAVRRCWSAPAVDEAELRSLATRALEAADG
jgi:hypothetical protein